MEHERPPTPVPSATKPVAPLPSVHNADRDGGASPKRAASDEDPDLVAEQKWQEEFDRRSRDARAGLHHPMVHELILGMPPLHDAYDADTQIFAERIVARLAEHGVTDGPMIDRLKVLTLAPTRAELQAASAALEEAWRKRHVFDAPHLAEASARCDYFAAVKNCRTSAFRVAGRALAYARDGNLPNSARLQLVEAALGWLLRAGWELPDVVEKLGPWIGGAPESRVAEYGPEIVRLIGILGEP